MKKPAGSKGKKVSFQVMAAPGSEVFVAGSFNEWDAKEYQLRDNPANGVYKTTIVLPPGRHEYKFVVNGVWHADPNCSEWAPNGHGSVNSVISV